MPTEKRIPERQCVGCGRHRPKAELVRVVKSPQGTLSVDTTGKAPGRGAYVCPDPACLAAARRARRLERAFAGPLSAELYQQLEEALARL